jgi:lipid-A-disaccharide synthase
MLKIYLIAGEASGDNLGAKLMRELKSQHLEVEFYGIGGEKMQAEGMNLLFPAQELSLMGFFEILPHIPKLLLRIKQTIEDICSINPDAVVTIDSPGFCFRVVKAIKNKISSKLIHYIAPTVWAYSPGRAKKIAALYDHLLVILPFESPYFLKEGLSTTFIGHPAVEDLQVISADVFRYKFNLAKGSLLLCLAPGSRAQEVKRLLPIFLEAADIFSKNIDQKLVIAIPVQKNLKSTIELYTKTELPIILVEEEDKQALFSATDLTLTKSGTITTELAFYQKPMVVAHKVNCFSYWLLKGLIKVKYVTIINLLAEKEVIPELLQRKCKPALIAQKLQSLLDDNRKRWEEEIQVNISKLSVDGERPSRLAAKKILDLLI